MNTIKCTTKLMMYYLINIHAYSPSSSTIVMLAVSLTPMLTFPLVGGRS